MPFVIFILIQNSLASSRYLCVIERTDTKLQQVKVEFEDDASTEAQTEPCFLDNILPSAADKVSNVEAHQTGTVESAFDKTFEKLFDSQSSDIAAVSPCAGSKVPGSHGASATQNYTDISPAPYSFVCSRKRSFVQASLEEDTLRDDAEQCELDTQELGRVLHNVPVIVQDSPGF